MSILTREAIHHINEHFRLADLCDEAYLYSQYAREETLRAQSKAFRAKVSDAQINAYLDADIEPPHTIGDEAHKAQVDAYFASLGE